MSDWRRNHAFMGNFNLLGMWHSRSTRNHAFINCNLTRHILPHSNRNNHSLFYQGKKVAPILRIWPLQFLKNYIVIHLCLLLRLLFRHVSTSDRWNSKMYWKHKGMGDIKREALSSERTLMESFRQILGRGSQASTLDNIDARFYLGSDSFKEIIPYVLLWLCIDFGWST